MNKMTAKKSLPATGLVSLGRIAVQAREARSRYESLEKQRDTMICELMTHGYSTRQLAEAAGITQARVVQVKSAARKRDGVVLDGEAKR